MYAFNIVPMCHMEKSKLTEQPEDVTEFPYNKLLLSSSEKSVHEKVITPAISNSNFKFV